MNANEKQAWLKAKRNQEASLEPGNRVKLRKARAEGDYHTATILRRLDDIEGGVILDRALAGFRCWNVADLKRVSTNLVIHQRLGKP